MLREFQFGIVPRTLKVDIFRVAEWYVMYKKRNIQENTFHKNVLINSELQNRTYTVPFWWEQPKDKRHFTKRVNYRAYSDSSSDEIRCIKLFFWKSKCHQLFRQFTKKISLVWWLVNIFSSLLPFLYVLYIYVNLNQIQEAWLRENSL